MTNNLDSILQKIKQPMKRIALTATALALMASLGYSLTLSGKIRKLDGPTTGAPIENAIIDVDGGAYTTTSNSTGDYSISGLSSGNHTIVAKKSGFRSINEQNYSLNADTTFNVCIPESIITTPMGTGVLNMDHMLELYPHSSEYPEGITWNPDSLPRPTFLSNANSLDTATFHRDLGAGTGNYLDSDTSSLEKKLGIGIFTLTTDSLAAADHGYVIRFGGTSNHTGYTPSSTLGNIKSVRTEINGHNPAAPVLPHEVAGFGFGKDYVYSFTSNMNTPGAPEWQLEDNILTSVQIWHRLARNRGEQNAHLTSYSNANGVEGQPTTQINPFKTFAIISTYPNPARSNLNISYTLPYSEKTTVSLYNVTGQKVADQECPAGQGQNAIRFNLTPYPAGVYVYRIVAKSQTATGKFVISR